MDLVVNRPLKINGETQILSSKSELHRLILISAFAKGNGTKIYYNGSLSEDVLATIGCVKSIGAKVETDKNIITVYPTSGSCEKAQVFCKESGSTLRFILPTFSAFGVDFSVTVSGRLGERPLSPMYEILVERGVIASENGKYPLNVSGKFTGGDITVSGNVSSQFISGMLMALPLTGKSGSITVTGEFQSKPYVDITVDAMRKFGVDVKIDGNVYRVPQSQYRSFGEVKAGGDWSNTAFFASMGALGGKMKITGLALDSMQGDKTVVEALKKFGAKVDFSGDALTIEKSELKGVELDCGDIPDLVPCLAVVASVAKGKTRFYNASRLKIKESDRIKSTVEMINALGGKATATDDGIEIEGVANLTGGTVNGYNDHRIVMSSAVASCVSDNAVKILGAQAVNKSFPNFFEIIKGMGFEIIGE